tara:strand:- start:378 stop:596 length:219 start_codon:yes stop_codon:yes gene_type:complete
MKTKEIKEFRKEWSNPKRFEETKTTMILEKQQRINRNKKNTYKKILKNIIAFIIVGIGSIGLLMLGAILDKI